MDRVNVHQAAIRRALSRRLKWQFRVLQNVLEGRNTTYRVSKMYSILYHLPRVSVTEKSRNFDRRVG